MITADTTSAPAEETAGSLAARARRVGMSPNHWYPAEFEHRLRPGGLLETKFWGESIALYRSCGGSVGAMENRCAHRHIKLTDGSVEGENVVCRYHGWTYDRTGSLVEMKHDDFGKKLPCIRMRSYPVVCRYGIIWIFPGDVRLAERTPLPEIPHGEGEGAWSPIFFDYTWKAHHSMVIDNLCNLTHLWVHGRWVPYDKTVLADSTHDGDRITLTWRSTLRRDILHPFMAPFFRASPGSNESDTFMIYDYPYQSALSNGKVRSCNFMLPIDEQTTRVFSVQWWSRLPVPFGDKLPRWLTALGVPAIKPITMEIFRQDGFTVEAEQKAYALHREKPIPEPNPMVKRFNELAVRKWEEWVRHRDAPGPTLEAERAATRVKVL